MNMENKQHLSDLMAYLGAFNHSCLSLPVPAGAKNNTDRYADTWWDEAVRWGQSHPDRCIGDARGESPNCSELIGFRLTVDNTPVTLVVLSYSQGGFEGCVLVDDHILTLEALVEAWLGDTTASDYVDGHNEFASHPILSYVA